MGRTGNGYDGWVLVTNDDGVDSPALPPLARELSTLATVRSVVPASERSWTGKIMSRFATLSPRPQALDGAEVWAVDGYPADCANLGVHSLFDTRPALVVSGVNMGSNAGLAFLLSSGTVGAAIEAVLGGVPAAAFSIQLDNADYRVWRDERRLTDSVRLALEHAAVVTREIVAEVLFGGLPNGASLLNVNMPQTVTPESPRVFAGVTRTGYGSYFAEKEAGRYSYSFSGLQVREPDPAGDVAVIERGAVAITAVRFDLHATPDEADRRRFERGG